MDLGELEYLKGIKDKVFLWLAERSLSGDEQFKISDLKDHFKTMSPQLLQQACDTLLIEKKISVPDRPGRILMYTIDKCEALKVAPKPREIEMKRPPLPKRAHSPNDGNALKSVKIYSINNNDNPQKKARINQPERELKGQEENSSSSSRSEFSQKYAQQYEAESDADSVYCASTRSESPMPFRDIATSSLDRELLGSMMGCLGVFFEEGEDVVKKGVLLEIIAKKVRPVTLEEFDEFLRFMEEENKLMVSYDDIYLI
mmetsp:Transcript_24099/g.23159  ORF Transcript_24099/g.23159 Transcript_24099/m.23159 type:complete len:258 (+) Transcript_24099:97-870(+)